MSDAINRPVNTRKREVHTGDMQLAQKGDVDLSLDSTIIHGEGLPNLTNDAELVQDLAFMEEPVTLRISASSGNKGIPETHVYVAVQGRGAEVMLNGKWCEITWLPIDVNLTTKRKYVEVLARANPESITTIHDDATVERPRNLYQRRPSAAYPMSIIQDTSRGAEWLSRIVMGH
jgi:hypothetical protein